MNASERLARGRATTGEAVELFDSMEPVDIDFMIGNWKGEGFQTGHTMDGLLEAYHWHGKRFDSSEDVHPLVFLTRGGRLACVNPALVGWALIWGKRFPLPRSAALGWLFQLFMPLFTTAQSRARLRMTTHRGKSTATMVYDQLPIMDAFRKIDDEAVFCVMDLKGMKKPFFFILRRAAASL